MLEGRFIQVLRLPTLHPYFILRGDRLMFDKIVAFVEKVEEWIISLAVIFMAILLIVAVIMRVVFNHSLTFSEELGQFSLIVVSFLGIGYCARKNRHINMSIVFDAVNNKIKKIMLYIICIVSAALMIVLFILSLKYIQSVIRLGKTSPALNIPMFWFYLSLPIGFLFAAIEYIRTFIVNLKHKDEVYVSSQVTLQQSLEIEEDKEEKEV